MTFPSPAKVRDYLDEVALPALEDVSGELRNQGVVADAQRVDEDGTSYVELVVDVGSEHPFRYHVRPRVVPIPAYGGWAPRGDDVYGRLEVHLHEGGQGYDVMGYTHGQLIDDVLDQYERHLEFLRLDDGAL